MKVPKLLKRKTVDDLAWGSKGKSANYFYQLTKCLSKASESDRKLLMAMAQKMIVRRGRAAEVGT